MYNDLKQVLIERAAEAGLTLPQDFYLFDVSLLDDIPFTTEGKVFTAEKEFFENNKTLGELIHWSPIAGVPIFSP